MRGLSLYSGGCNGMGIAAAMVGMQTLAYCDSDLACRVLLHQREPQIPIFRSDEDVTLDALRANGIDPAGIDIVYGSPPCQCASVAGKRLGDADPRNRWPEFLRIVRDVRPRWVLAENVPGLLTVNDGRLFGDILRQLAQAGYDAEWDCWDAADVGAPHGRKRLFIIAKLADASGEGLQEWASGKSGQTRGAEKPERYGTGMGDAERAQRGAGEPTGHVAHGDDAGRAEAAGRAGTSGKDDRIRDVADADRQRQLQPGGIIAQCGGRTGDGNEMADTEGAERTRARREAWGRWGEFRRDCRRPAEPGLG